jgi:hypothetical protein
MVGVLGLVVHGVVEALVLGVEFIVVRGGEKDVVGKVMLYGFLTVTCTDVAGVMASFKSVVAPARMCALSSRGVCGLYCP